MQARFSVHSTSVPANGQLHPPQRILVRGVNWLGDAVMTTPALARLRERFPDARITLLTAAKLAPLWSPHPAVDDVVSFAADEGLLSVARRLRAGRFDLALLLPNAPRAGLEARLAGIPRRVGIHWPWRDWLLTDVVPTDPRAVGMRRRKPAEILARLREPAPPPNWGLPAPGPESHQLFHYLRLVAALGADPTPLPPRLGVAPAEIADARERLGLAPGIRWIGFNVGAEYGPAKRWPVESFAAVARAVATRPGHGLVFFGGNSDIQTVARILAALGRSPAPVRNLAGRTSLRDLAASLAACEAVITNDTGPMHVAAAVGTRVIVPFGSTSPELTGPGLPGEGRHALLKSDAPCAPCFLRECPADLRCLRRLEPDAILAALGS